MTKKITKKLVAIAMAATMMFGASVAPSIFDTSDFLSISASAASNVNSLPTNIKCYPISTGNNTPAFSSPGATSKSGTIYAADLCTIKAIYGNGYMTVEYPTSRGSRMLYTKISAFFNSSTYEIASISKYSVAYRRSSGNATIGSVDNRDTKVYVLGGVVNGRYQIIYRVGTTGNTYKLGWVPSSVVKFASNQSSNTSTSFSWPLSNYYVCGNNWSTYYKAKNGDHLGLDIKSKTGDTNVYAAANGTVTQSGWNSANGNCVVIAHSVNGKTVYSFYGHLKSRSVSVGQKVSKGSKIGIIGNTGSSSTGVHLHFAITTQNSCGTWGYTKNKTFDNNAKSVSWQGYTYFNPYYVIQNGKLP